MKATHKNKFGKKYVGMELKEWKEIESGANMSIQQAIKDITIAEILHNEAINEIHKLGGKSEEEQADEFNKNTV